MSDDSNGKSKLVILALFALAVLGTFAFILLRKDRASTTASQSAEIPQAASGASGPPPAVTEIRFLYSTEKRAWLADALVRFGREHPEIRVISVEKGSFDMVQALLEKGERPTLVSPADDIALNLLNSDWRAKNAADLIPSDGEDRAVPLVITPLVFVAWEDRAASLVAKDHTLTFDGLRKAIEDPKGWSGVGGKADWGFVKLGHTNPTRSNSGLQALALMAYEFHKKRMGLEVKDLLDERFQAFVKAIEKGVPKFGDSTGTFMDEMVLYGPSKYDVVVTYENLAIQHIPNAQGRWGNLRVFYPPQTMWSSHPIAALRADWVTPAQLAAAKQLIRFLLGKPEQQRALALGFRPANPEVPILSADGNTPFKSAEAFGIKSDLGTVVEAPPGTIIRNLIEMWARLIAR